ncbi:MAG: hypothetical protein JWR68_3130 [Polaromonas sp.]|nr:hypothetical protein [Polaromonas sp.]
MEKLSLGGTTLEAFHVCAFFNSKEEEYDVLTPFFQEGMAQGEKNLHIVDPAFALEHKTRLSEGGIDVEGCESCGQLEVVHWQDAYFNESGAFDKDRMLAMVDHLTGTGRDAGYSRLRIMGNMDWAATGVPGSDKLMEYEADVNEVLSRNRQPAVCVYDISKLTGVMMMDLLRTHPLTLIGGVIQENAFYTAPGLLREERRLRAAPMDGQESAAV